MVWHSPDVERWARKTGSPFVRGESAKVLVVQCCQSSGGVASICSMRFSRAACVGSRLRVQCVAGVAETIKCSVRRPAAAPSYFLSVALSVASGGIASATDPRVAEHDPCRETGEAHESEEADGYHFGVWPTRGGIGRSHSSRSA
jgi:hypothetical protein